MLAPVADEILRHVLAEEAQQAQVDPQLFEPRAMPRIWVAPVMVTVRPAPPPLGSFQTRRRPWPVPLPLEPAVKKAPSSQSSAGGWAMTRRPARSAAASARTRLGA